MNTGLIKCGTDGLRPWSIVCIHLCDGASREWIPILKPDNGEAIFDWVCPDCYEDWDRMMEECDISMLRPACINCVDRLRAQFDPTYVPDPPISP